MLSQEQSKSQKYLTHGYLAFTMASMVCLSCGLNCPLPVSTLRVTWKFDKKIIARKLKVIDHDEFIRPGIMIL